MNKTADQRYLLKKERAQGPELLLATRCGARWGPFATLSLVVCGIFLTTMTVRTAEPAAQPHVAAADADDLSQLDAYLRARSTDYGATSDEAEERRLQLLVGELLVRDDAGEFLVQHGVRPDAEYVYPGTTIHLVAAVAAIQAVRDLGGACATTSLADIVLEFGFTPTTPHQSPRVGVDERRTIAELLSSSLRGGAPEAFNRLYDFVGRDELNLYAWSNGLSSVRIQHRTRAAESREMSGYRPATTVRCGEAVHHRQATASAASVAPTTALRAEVGDAYIADEEGAVVHEPMGFSTRNYVSMRDQQRLFLAVLRPGASAFSFGLTDADREWVLAALNVRDAETGTRPDLARVGTLSVGVERALRHTNADIYSLTGRAYGFISETSAFYLPAADRIVIVSGTLYTNENGVLNDDRYEYGDVTVPLFRAIGRRIAEYYRLRYLGG